MILNNLEELMAERNINISQLSSATDISRNTISSLVNKGSELSSFQTRTLETLASFFGVDIGDLLIFVDDSIIVKDCYSLTSEQSLLQSSNGSVNKYKGEIKFTLVNEFKKEFIIHADITCLTNLESNHPLVSNKKTLFDIVIDNKDISNHVSDNQLSRKLIDTLFTKTFFVGKSLVPWIYSLWGEKNDDINLKSTPLFTLDLTFKYSDYNKRNFNKVHDYCYQKEKKDILMID